ncbi:DUF882 domain-containing protein [Rhodoblastus acidophilus]|uniref:Murein endopeptidase K n=1 Tax=Candidatus Rhodoblastus alkanivorans TaxID=2954117 RepID=A0ABS9Z4C0_9HYPH|nr:DUF882 domain-containing protein [Candidatus Rhodoblastus alkanivorans]MCI4680774.1 DUF882 domain-containing protein [Candidatus Rhodoblastus alkanivorans]MCI4682478.1 DUF882 domain-containing protein [Candidatus Rhodoblastus alkanivorans]MDI4639784.1 DUF882 domain-containing protein [Rhodoblastus acidophilus]
MPKFAAKQALLAIARPFGKRFCVAALGLLALLAPRALESADANGDTRTLYLYHAHRKDSIAATFRVNGHYDLATLQKLNWFLRDWRNDEETKMDPRLFDVLWEAYRGAGRMGPDDPIIVLSAYRCPATNAMLRRRSHRVAEHSQHMLGKAMDTTIPGLSMEKLREIGMRMERGGVGYYPTLNFVHLDVGGVRHWPRMSYDQLAKLFPDGKTVFIASNGKTLPGYEEARAEIMARGGQAPTVAEANSGGIFGFFAKLFGGGRDEEEDRQLERAPAPTRVATAQPEAPAPRQMMADAEANLPHGETYMGAGDAGGYGRQAITAQEPAARAAAQEAPAVPTPPVRPAAAEPPQTAEAATPAPVLDLPTPPRRPDDLFAASDAPLPPPRPVELAALPDVITRGPAAGASLGWSLKLRPSVAETAPGAETLAYAATAAGAVPLPPPRPPMPSLRAAARGKAAEQRAVKAVAREMTPARLDRASIEALAAPTRQSRARPPVRAGFAPALRAASRLDALSGAAAVDGAPTGFKSKAARLSANSFTPD